ncbi:acyl transferase/acyl hydrolase/lysophospholipase [Paraphoma chrysanthemicola]|uniref:Acyl transferase/acyl hydrolase/lysophospholipase n=1 Tax=Paraphoma chrysanthemicola TaxID=798071 RepID=A0A8K0W5X8_9PLEO|nr:acyl transferase/acyl hydrolase/lysophospholipase [Paraphoma chrysanthemicola]
MLKRLWGWWFTKSKRDQFLDHIGEARIYEEWIAAARSLDECMDYDMWRQDPMSKHYNYRLIQERSTSLYTALEEQDIDRMVKILQPGLVRNLGNITSSPLYNKAFEGTKFLIEDYVGQVADCIDLITMAPVTPTPGAPFSHQEKLETLHSMRLALGRTALVLQGGAIFGLCHLGVVKALHLRGLLPRIIVGTATGALIAALVGVHTEEDLLQALSGSHINIEAFTKRSNANTDTQRGWTHTLLRRLKRWWATGHLLDVDVLEEVLKANIGDLTFEEAYEKTKRILNITVNTSGGGGVPSLLNYMTAPNVLIRCAALASNTTASSALYRPVTVLCKNHLGEIEPWPLAAQATFRPSTHASYGDRRSPLHRLSQLFNVNHYIVSQARPYLAPFLRSDLHHPNPKQDGRWRLVKPILRFAVLEVQHRLRQLDQLGLMSPSIRRFLLDEDVPGASLTVVPELSPTDFLKLLENPTTDMIDYWIHKGERSVWPAVAALLVRTGIEIEIERGYQVVRRRRQPAAARAEGTKVKGHRKRTQSFDQGGGKHSSLKLQ